MRPAGYRAAALVLGIENPSPGHVLAALFQERRAVDRTILAVQLVGEFVQDEVLSVVDVRRPGLNVVPGKHDDPAGPRLAETGRFALQDDWTADRFDFLGHVGAGVNQDRDQPGVNVGLAMEQEQARLGRDGHLDLIRQLEAAAALERLLGEEDLDQPAQLLAIGVGQAA